MESPAHYGNNWDVGDFIRQQGLNFHLGNAIKYICRADYKGNKAEDLKKAIHYLENELQHTTNTSKGVSDIVWRQVLGDTSGDAESFDR
jgi:hypothetical protein